MKKLSALAFILFCCFSFARADERVLSFNSELTVNADASVTVAETITVNVEHREIRRGIVRVLPTSVQKHVTVNSLFMDGSKHPWFTERRGGNIEVNFGDDNYLPRGTHTYRLEYTVKNEVRFFKDYNEIYWNVTGNDWIFPIDSAAFTVTLPPGAEVKEDLISTYTGRKGSKSSDAVKTGPLSFTVTQTIAPGEGFTVAVPWQKGVIAEPTQNAAAKNIDGTEPVTAAVTKLVQRVSTKNVDGTPHNAGIIGAAAGVIILMFFYLYLFVIWRRFGKDPDDPFVTEFKPPEGISPSFMRYMINKNCDMKNFSAALISMAMKDAIGIKEEKEFLSTSVSLILKNRDMTGISGEERGIMHDMFFITTPRNMAGLRGEELEIMSHVFTNTPSRFFELSQVNGARLKNIYENLKANLQQQGKKYIEKNRKYLTGPIIALAFMHFPLIFIRPILLFVSLYCVFFMFLVSSATSSKLCRILVLLGLTFFSTPFLNLMFNNTVGATGLFYQICILFAFCGFYIYFNVIDNYTQEGRALMSKIKGFKRYMEIAEEGRVAASDPYDAERIFADYLPYAFAFDMQNKWMKAFAGRVSQAAIDKYTAKTGGARFISGAALTRALIFSMPSSSGSGSGGGGFSGGGGGGGGGRGR